MTSQVFQFPEPSDLVKQINKLYDEARECLYNGNSGRAEKLMTQASALVYSSNGTEGHQEAYLTYLEKAEGLVDEAFYNKKIFLDIPGAFIMY